MSSPDFTCSQSLDEQCFAFTFKSAALQGKPPQNKFCILCIEINNKMVFSLYNVD